MHYQLLVVATLTTAAVVQALLAVYAFSRRHSRASRYFGFLALNFSVLCLVSAFQTTSLDRHYMEFWVVVEHLALGVFLSTVFFFTLAGTDHSPWLKKAVIVPMLAVSALALIINASNPLHHLAFIKIGIAWRNSFASAVITPGPWFYIQNAIMYGTIFFCLVLYAQKFHRSPPGLRIQPLLILLGAVPPLLGILLYNLGFSPWNIDLSSIGYFLTSIVYALALFRFNLFNIIPHARDRIFEGMHEAVLILDRKNRLVDFNPAASDICNGYGSLQLGKPLDKFGDCSCSSLAEKIEASDNGEFSFEFSANNEIRHFQCYVFPIGQKAINPMGKALIMIETSAQVRLMEHVRRLASIDHLTGIYNRRQFIEICTIQLDIAREQKNPASLIMIDIDHFKEVNDTWGHQVGDKVLVDVVKTCRKQLRESDIFGRFGGEEFVVFLPDTDLRRARQVADRMRQRLEERQSESEDAIGRVTASFGISMYKSPRPPKLEELINQADNALYQAKRNGRNRVEVYPLA